MDIKVCKKYLIRSVCGSEVDQIEKILGFYSLLNFWRFLFLKSIKREEKSILFWGEKNLGNDALISICLVYHLLIVLIRH